MKLRPILMPPMEDAYADKELRREWHEAMMEDPRIINAVFALLNAQWHSRNWAAMNGKGDIETVKHGRLYLLDLENEIHEILEGKEFRPESAPVMREDSTLPDGAYLHHPDITTRRGHDHAD